MNTQTDQLPIPATPLVAHGVVARTLDDHLRQLGDISVDRIRLSPAIGTATFADCVAANESRTGRLCEWIDGTLVEKAMGFEASVVAAAIIEILRRFVSKNRLGLISGADGFFRLNPSTRAPDVAFVGLDQLPDGKFPTQAYPEIAPKLVVEVLSEGNTKGEMNRKRLEYFLNGVQLVWIVDCVNRSVAVYSEVNKVAVVGETGVIDGGQVLPGFSAKVADFFADLDLGRNS
jgi:Uma2 family endonuclease